MVVLNTSGAKMAARRGSWRHHGMSSSPLNPLYRSGQLINWLFPIGRLSARRLKQSLRLCSHISEWLAGNSVIHGRYGCVDIPRDMVWRIIHWDRRVSTVALWAGSVLSTEWHPQAGVALSYRMSGALRACLTILKLHTYLHFTRLPLIINYFDEALDFHLL